MESMQKGSIRYHLGNDVEEMYWHLRTKAVLYDVPEKPIQIEGPDAAKFLDKVFSRTISSMKVNRGSMP